MYSLWNTIRIGYIYILCIIVILINMFYGTCFYRPGETAAVHISVYVYRAIQMGTNKKIFFKKKTDNLSDGVGFMGCIIHNELLYHR